MKNYLYYATEENGFETEKHLAENPYEDVKDTLLADYIGTDVAESIAYTIKGKAEKNGFAVAELENGQGYTIIIGIARFGKCKELSAYIADARKEFIANF